MKVETYKVELAEYMIELKEDTSDKLEWKDNGPRIFNLILLHFPPTLITKLEAQPGYDACKDARNTVALLKLM